MRLRRTAQALSLAHVHGVTQTVARQIETHRCDEDHGSRQSRNDRIDPDYLPQIVQHQPPFRIRWRDAEAQEREARCEDDANADQAGRVYQDRPQNVVEDMIANDRERTAAAGIRGFDEVEMTNLRRNT